MHRRTLKTLVPLVVAGIALVALVPASAKVTNGSPGASPASPTASKHQAYCDRFVDHLANGLHKKPDEVRSAAKQAALDTLEDAVKAGDVTRAQADKIRARVGKRSLCSGIGSLGSHKGGPDKKHGGANGLAGPHGVMAEYADASAKALGISTADLTAELKGGKTLHQVADAHGKSEADFKTALLAEVSGRLDTRVAAGTITRAQADAVLTHLRAAPHPPGWDHALPQGPPE